jgi:cell wall-associated NlpC family hydrolase
MTRGTYILLVLVAAISACRNNVFVRDEDPLADTTDHTEVALDTSDIHTALPPSFTIDTRNVKPGQLVDFAKTLIGTPYRYGSIDPQQGFDCSGFITYVFNQFDIAVPRSSRDFANVGNEVDVHMAKPGDLILFTGTDSTNREIGHMGIITGNTDSIRFIHSSSGKAYGVTVTPLNNYYRGRYVKTIRIFD